MLPMTIGKPALPGNSQITYLFDSTRILAEAMTPAASASGPGTYRRMWAGARWFGFICPTGQTITVAFELLWDPDGTTSAAWATDTNGPLGGSFTVATTIVQPWNWLPGAADYRVKVTAGATAPTDIDAQSTMVMDRSSGV